LEGALVNCAWKERCQRRWAKALDEGAHAAKAKERLAERKKERRPMRAGVPS
jgi:hypothetical protein